MVGAYFFITDPYNLKPLFFGSDTPAVTKTSDGTAVDKNPALSDSQEDALEKVGIDPAAVPSSITPEQESCFRDKLGDARVDEIIAGDSPTPVDIFKAGGCI